MTSADRLELNDLIDQLTQPHDTVITRHGQLLGHRTQPALLHQLRAATASTITAGGRGGTIGPKIPLDPVALTQYEAIRARIRKWAHHARVPLDTDWNDPAAVLRAWNARTLHHNPAAYLRTLRSWITTIHALVVDPDHRWPLNAPCPICDARKIEVGDDTGHTDGDGTLIDALWVIARDPATNSQTICRACGAHWDGLDGAEHLAALLTKEAS